MFIRVTVNLNYHQLSLNFSAFSFQIKKVCCDDVDTVALKPLKIPRALILTFCVAFLAIKLII